MSQAPRRWAVGGRRYVQVELPPSDVPHRRETSARPVALGSSRVPCGLCNSYRRAPDKRGLMIDGRPCLNLDCVKGWRKRTRSDPWWDSYLEQEVPEPAKAPQLALAESRVKNRRVKDPERIDFLIQGGWRIDKAGTNGMPDGKPIAGNTDLIAIEAYVKSRLDGALDDVLLTFRYGPIPPHLGEARKAGEQVIAELVNERYANTGTVAIALGCSRRLVQTIANRAREESCA